MSDYEFWYLCIVVAFVGVFLDWRAKQRHWGVIERLEAKFDHLQKEIDFTQVMMAAKFWRLQNSKPVEKGELGLKKPLRPGAVDIEKELNALGD
jgi:hypothetical protein